MGTKGIELIISQSEVYHQDRDTLPGGVESDLKDQVNTQILPLKMKAEELMGSMDSVLTAIGMVFDQENRENLAMSFNSITKTLNNLQGTSVYLDEFIRNESVGVTGLIKNQDSVSQSLISRANELRDFIANLTRISDTLAGAPLEESFKSLNEVLIGLHETMFTITEGSGTLGKIIYSDSLYVALLATNASLNRLIEDIRINPSRYVSLSMNDRRRTYLNLSDSDLAKALEGEGILTYYLCVDSRILESEETYKTPPELAGLNDIQIGQQLFYNSYKSQKIEGCIRRLERERKSWPNAGIYTWVGGAWTRLNL
jgi:phospholipid/cholesterol/gamma-HCH transport system substrate-binding protein